MWPQLQLYWKSNTVFYKIVTCVTHYATYFLLNMFFLDTIISLVIKYTNFLINKQKNLFRTK